MADLSKIKLNGTTYNLKDATARFIDIPLTLSYNSQTEEYNLTYTGSHVTDVNQPNARLIVTTPDSTIKIFYRMVSNYDSFSTLDVNDSFGLSSIIYNGSSFQFNYVNVMNLADITTLATVATSGDYDDLIDAPEPEDDEDVEDMLDGFDLDYTTNTLSVNQWQGGNY